MTYKRGDRISYIARAQGGIRKTGTITSFPLAVDEYVSDALVRDDDGGWSIISLWDKDSGIELLS